MSAILESNLEHLLINTLKSLHWTCFENGKKVGVSDNPKPSETFRNRVKESFSRRMISDSLVVLALSGSYQKLFVFLPFSDELLERKLDQHFCLLSENAFNIGVKSRTFAF